MFIREPVVRRRRPGGMLKLPRPPLAMVVALGLTAVPTVSALACSCMDQPFEQAVSEADLAIVGTLLETTAPVAGDPSQPIAMTWAVERSRDAIDVDRATVIGWPDDGANCGVSFEVGDRWILLAYLGENGLETNGCMQNRPLEESDAEAQALAEEMLPVAATVDPVAASGFELPPAVLIGAAALVVVVGLSLLAFRRRSPGDA